MRWGGRERSQDADSGPWGLGVGVWSRYSLDNIVDCVAVIVAECKTKAPTSQLFCFKEYAR